VTRKRASIAVETERLVPGFTKRMLAHTQAKGDPALMRQVLDFLSWEPTLAERRRVVLIARITRDGPPLTEPERAFLNDRSGTVPWPEPSALVRQWLVAKRVQRAWVDSNGDIR